jgi:hypothetical protein
MVDAEVARLEGRELDAERLYEQAIRLARKHGFIQNEGIANEIAARFYAARGLDTIADAYLRNARECYLRWGALGKVKQLEQLHPHLWQEPASLRSDNTTGTLIEQLDLATVVKVSQAVSSEIDLKKLLDTLMVTALEHAGGERGLLIVPQGDELWIEAEAVTVRDKVDVHLRHAAVAIADLPESVLRYVIRTQDSVLLDDALEQNPYSGDAYIRQKRCRSVLCLPLIKQATLIGVLYLENSLTSHVFTPARVSTPTCSTRRHTCRKPNGLAIRVALAGVSPAERSFGPSRASEYSRTIQQPGRRSKWCSIECIQTTLLSFNGRSIARLTTGRASISSIGCSCPTDRSSTSTLWLMP